MDLAIRGKLALFFDKESSLRIIKNPLILVEDNEIIDIDSYPKIKKQISGHDIIGDENQLLIPGMSNCHTHLAMTIFRGLADDLPLQTWLQEHIWPLEDKLTGEDVLKGAKLGVMESILSGVTTVNSMYWFPSFEAKAIEEVGARGLIAAPLITGITTLNDAKKVVENHHNTIKKTIRVCLALHAPYTVTISDFKKAQTYLQEYNIKHQNYPDLLIHTHLAESDNELKTTIDFNKEHGEELLEVDSVVELFDKKEILDDHTVAAHCINISEKDLEILKQKEVRISLNPVSNAKLGNNMPPLPKIISKITNVGIGTDGAASNNTLDLFDTIRFLALYYKGFKRNPTVVKSEEVFKLATLGGAKALNWEGIGTLEKGSLADIVTINLNKAHLTPSNIDKVILNHFAYSMKGNDVENVIINGDLILENREFLKNDLTKAIKDVNQVSENLVKE